MVPLFATGVVDTGGKFAAGFIDTVVSTTLAKLVAKFASRVVDTSGKKFAAGGAPWLANISVNFQKIGNGPNGLLWG